MRIRDRLFVFGFFVVMALVACYFAGLLLEQFIIFVSEAWHKGAG